MKISEIIICDQNKINRHSIDTALSAELEAKKLIPIMYGDNQREKEDLELQKLRAEIHAIEAEAALHRAEAKK